MGKTPRRFADRPSITIRALMWFVLMGAIFNGFFMVIARQLRASGLPVELIHRQELAVFLLVNATALSFSLYVFYAPWWRGKSRGEWLKIYLMQRVPVFLPFLGAQLLIRGREDAGLYLLLFTSIFVCGPLLLTLGL